MIEYADGEVTNLLPEYFTKDPYCISLSYAIKRAVSKMLFFSERTKLYGNIHALPEEILDYLALELNVTYYDTEYDIDKKRDLIQNSILLKMYAGTKYAVDVLCDNIFYNADVTEWFDFQEKKEPGQFDVSITADQQIHSEMYSKFSSLIEQVKNASSHIRTIDLKSPAEVERYIGVTAWHSPASPVYVEGSLNG